jgi:hypothetical protein
MPSSDPKAHDEEKPQRLHLVFGGELKSLDSHEFRDPAKIDIVGLFPDYASAERAWRTKAQRTVDSAQTRYFIVHLHRLIEPDLAPPTSGLSASWQDASAGRSSARGRSASYSQPICGSCGAPAAFRPSPRTSTNIAGAGRR